MASTIKVDNVQNQPGTNIINKCSTTITLGACGDTVALASGASQTGFGREGSVDWQTGSIKTGTFTAVSGEGYFVNTSGGTSIVNLPAGSAGAIVAVADYTRTFNSNNCTITPNGSEKIGGTQATAALDVNGQSATFVYVDGTEGWINVQETETSVAGTPPFLLATGGTPACGTTSGDYRIHTFTGPGTFCVSRVAPGPSGNPNGVDYLVIAGGGGGGSDYGAGGGAGGYRESVPSPAAWTGSPIAKNCGAITVTASPYTITVGGGGPGGTGGCDQGTDGSDSTFSTITSAGGGGGGSEGGPQSGRDGGSGGGAAYNPGPASVGAGDVPNVTPDQGFPGGDGIVPGTGGHAAGGGGGSGAVGVTAPSAPVAGAGGAGVTSCISATPTQRGGGGGGAGGGGGQPYTYGAGGAGGGGRGAINCGPTPDTTGESGADNTGGGGGGGVNDPTQIGGDGGSGLVILRYKFQ